jgi:hypothetical protein
MDIPKTGRCLCGSVHVSVRTANTRIGACHCSTCRKWGGGPLLALDCGTEVDFQGEDRISVFASSMWAERGFCSTCGSHLFYRLKKERRYFLPVGLLDGDDWVLDHQVFIDEQPAYYTFANETKKLTGAELFAQFAPPGS